MSEETSSTIILADPADLCLQIPLLAENKYIKVSSTVLCLASKVFMCMLGENSKFRESQLVGREEAQIILQDDDYDSLLTILRVIHMQTASVPFTNTVQNIYHIAVVCDKYEIAAPLLPWIQLWTSSLPDSTTTSDSLKWLFISWVFRKPAMFQRFSKHLIMATILNNGMELMTDEGEPFPDVIPDRLIAAIKACRQEILDELSTIPTREFETYCKYKSNERSVCRMREKKNECDAMCLGIILRYLISSGMWPKMEYPNSKSIRSVVDELDKVENFGSQITYFQQGIAYNQANHSECGPKGRIDSATAALMADFNGLELRAFYENEEIFFRDELPVVMSDEDYED
ncbi:hypothetical protein BDZ91DRAFT_853693 [Kalaharituber pfeilii]|nr:hypothetical protein BDZ91DRAFT_853693 [Kalaharituber pfeilii]